MCNRVNFIPSRKTGSKRLCALTLIRNLSGHLFIFFLYWLDRKPIFWMILIGWHSDWLSPCKRRLWLVPSVPHLLLCRFLHAWTHSDDLLVASLVYHTGADWLKQQTKKFKRHTCVLRFVKQRHSTTMRSSHLDIGSPAFRKPPWNQRQTWSQGARCATRESAASQQLCASPDELPAVETEGGLPQVGRHELVSVDLVDPPSHGAVALPGELLVRLLLHRGFVWSRGTMVRRQLRRLGRFADPSVGVMDHRPNKTYTASNKSTVRTYCIRFNKLTLNPQQPFLDLQPTFFSWF